MGKNKKKQQSYSKKEEKQAKRILVILGISAVILMCALWVASSLM